MTEVADAMTNAESASAPETKSTTRSRRGAKLSIVIPMHNEEEVLDILFQRLDEVSARLRLETEFVCVDDGSSDRTLQLLQDRAAHDPRLQVLPLARNFGKEAALTAGLDNTTGDLVVPLDADLQDPPELIEEFLALWEQGYDVVYGIRSDRTSDSVAKRLTAGWFYKIFNSVADYPIPPNTGDFRLMDRIVVDALRQLPERNRFNKGLFSWVGFRQIGVPYVRPPRAAGASSWASPALWRLAFDGITSFSTTPLRVWSMVGVAAAGMAALYGVYLVLRVLILGRDVPGYASLAVITLFCFAGQMLAFGIMGEYLGRLYQEVKARPVYIIRK